MTPQPMICVRDVEASSRWYQAALGLKSGHGGAEYEMLMAGDVMALQLHHWDAHEHPHIGNPDQPHGNGVVLWFFEKDVDGACERAKKAGAQVLEELHFNPLAHHREFWLRDPDGYVIAVSGEFQG